MKRENINEARDKYVEDKIIYFVSFDFLLMLTQWLLGSNGQWSFVLVLSGILVKVKDFFDLSTVFTILNHFYKF